MERREHDIMMDMIANQGMSFDNLVTVGLNANNTSLQDKSTYENNEWVREHFKDQYGEFDKTQFEAFYNNAKVYYNALASANYDESMKRQATYHRDNIFAPIEQRRKGPDFMEFQMANPYQTTSSIYELGRVGERTKSIDEIAQANKVLLNPTTAGENLENAQWGDTPNDSFWGYFTDTLVMAQYDQDGTHIDPFTGEQVEHKAGDLKLDNTGNFYYEKLDGRDIYGRRVLNKMNVLTTDGSFWNQYDFFDSDDINQKSIGGTVLKNLALVGTMFIPYVGPWIAGLSIATQAAGLLGTLGKMAGGSDAPTWSALEGWSKSVSRQGATTEYAQEHTWCWENFINLIGDVAGQLKEQRFIFKKVPYIFKGANMRTKEGQAAKLAQLTEKQMKLTQSSMEELRKTGASAAELVRAEAELKTVAALKAQADLDSFIKGYNKLGEVLSKGYMTAITVGDTYGEAKAAGASDLDATLLTLGYAAGEYAILNTGLGEWILPELRAGRYKSQAIARALTSVDAETQNLYKKFGQQLSNFSKEGKKEYTKKLFNIGRDIARAEYANGTRTLTATLASAAGEGVEEVSEELLADFSKGCYDAVKWLQGEDTRLNSFGYDFSKGTWNGSELIDRYGMSLIGGFVGGGLTNLGTNYKMINGFNNMTSEKAIQEVVYMARNGGLQDFLRQVDKMQLGDVNLSATQYEVDGNNIVFAPGTKENNQDLYIKQALRNQVKMIEGILQANGAVSDSRFLDAQTLGDLRFNALHKSATAGRYLQEYNSLSSKIVRLVQAINDKVASTADANGDGTVTDREQRKAQMSSEDQAAVRNLEEELKETKKQMEDLVSGKRAYEFIADSLFELTTALSSKFTATTFPLFAEQKYGKKFSELTEEDKAKALEEYKNWKTTEGREQLHTLAQIYLQVAGQSSQVIKNHEQAYMQTSQELLSLNSFISKLYTEVRQGAQLFHLPFVADETKYLELAQDASDNSLAEVGTRLVQLLGTEQDSIDLRAILERANTIDPQATEEERTQQRNQIVKDYADKLDEILINNAPTFVQSFIERGFANTETRNQLTQLLQVVHNRAQAKVAEWEQWAEENLDYRELSTAVNPYLQASQQVLNSLRAVEQLSATPIEQNLNEFAISIGNEPINLTQLIERLNASFNDVTDNVTKFNMDEELYKDLNNAIYTLELYQASIRGARTDGANLSNIFGYNATLNEVAGKIEGSEQPQLAEIDKNVADVFDEDIKANLNKLQFLKRLYEVNQGQKLTKQDRVATKKDLLIYKRLKNIVSILDDDPLKDWEGFLDLQNAINGMTIHEQLLRDNNTTVSEQQREDFEKEKLAAENAIYDFFQIESNRQKLNDPAKLAEFINPSKLQLYTEANELLNEGLDNLDDNSLVWWMASRAALRSQDFYYQYRQIIDPQAENPMAPISTQELAIYNNYASVVNGNIFTAFYNAYRQAIVQDWQRKSVEERKQILERLGKFEGLATDELAPYAINFLSAPRYQNIVLTEGIPGSGKSTGVFQSTLRLLKQFHPEVLSSVAVVHGANADSAVSLRDDIGLTQDNSKTYGRTEWMKEVNPNWREYPRSETDNAYQVPASDYTVTAENEIRSSLGVRDTTTPPSLIIIDEISKFSAYDLDQIDKYAKKYGITVLVAGDFDQSGVVGGHSVSTIPAFNGLTWKIELSRTNFIRAPKLGVSMRTDNSLKTTNLQRLQAYMQDPDGAVDFNYFQDETGLFGDKVLNYSINDNENASNVLFQVLQDVQAMIATLKEGQKIGYIYTDKASPIYAALSQDQYKNFIDFREGGSAQGLEGQYYIIEANPAPISDGNSPALIRDLKKTYLKDVYTGISRAQQGSLIIAPLEYQGVKFNSTPVSEKISEQISTNTIATFARKRKDVLDKVASEGRVGNIIPRTSEVIPQSASQSTAQGGLAPGIPAAPTQPTLAEKKAQLLQEMEEAEDIADLDYVLWEVQNNNPELGNDPDVIEAHRRISDRLAPPPPPTPAPQPSTEAVITPLSHEDLVQKYGDKLNIDKFTITVDGVTIPLTIDQMPFVTRDMDTRQLRSGTSNIINHYDRNLVVVNIGGFHQPFYMSTGHGGKATVAKGQWYPIFGISAEGWLNKGTEEQINNYYGSPILQAIAERLNELLGTGLQAEMMGPPTPTVFREGFVNPVLDFINQDMHPVENHTETTVEQVNNNISEAVDVISRKINEIKQSALPTVAPQTETLTYEEDIAPITQTDVINDQTYQQQIDEASKTENVPESTVIPQGEAISIDMLLHTFNTFETGVAVGEDGKPAPIGSQQWMDSRIDSINGLVKVDQALGRPVRTVQEYVQLIGKLRNILFNTADKSQIYEKIQNLLGLSGIYCTFALKSSPRPGEGNRAEGREFVSSNPTPYDKGISEQTMFNGSMDERSHEWHPKSIVAIIGTKGSGNLLELPLIALSSPFTLLQTKDVNGAQVFSQMFNIYDQMIKSGENLHTIAQALVDKFDGIPQYQELVDLFKLYNFTDAGIFYIDNPQWTPVQDLQFVGSQFITDKGYYQEAPGLSMNDTTNPEAEWITLQDFAKNPQIVMTKNVMVSMDGFIEGVDKPVVNAGHPFVLVSFNRNLNNDTKILAQFSKQQKDPSTRQEVKLMYVLPPKATIGQYLENLHKILNKEQGVENIGNLFTSYKLLRTLMQDEEFRSVLNSRLPGAVEAVQQLLSELEGKSQAEQKDLLYETRDWTTIGGLGKQKMAGLFDAALANIAYTRRSMGNGQYSFNINQANVDIIERILNQAGITGVYHKVKVAKDSTSNGYFMVPEQGQNYTIGGKPFKIHGKLDSYTFRGQMGWLVSSALSKLRQGNNGHSFSVDGQSYMRWDPVARVGRPGNSDITAPVRSRQETETERHIRNTIEYVKRKLGADVSSVFEGKTIQEAQKQIVEQINANNNQVVAFTIGNQLLISNKSTYFDGPVYIYDANGQPLTDISAMVDNNGKYNFTISTTLEGKQVQFDVTYDGVNKEMEMIQPMEAQPTATISVTPENFVEYMDAGRRILEPLFDNDFFLANVFATTTYEEFLDALQNMIYVGEEFRIAPLEALLPTADPLQTQIINDIIAIERSNNPDKQDVTEENASCPPTIKIKF